MNSSSRPLPTSLKWLMRIFGVLLILLSLATATVTGVLGGLLKKVNIPADLLARLRLKNFTNVPVGLGIGFGIAVVLIVIGFWLLRRSLRKPAPEELPFAESAPELAPAAAAVKPLTKAKKANYQYANVLRFDADRRQVWQFGTAAGGFALQSELSGNPVEKLPGNIGGKGWRGLIQKRLNIAWLPAEKVFLRAMQVPVADFDETLSMIELQLEKISPLPVAQIVWTIEIVPQKLGADLQTVIVVVVPRSLVEEYLGQLEQQGYLADRIELPLLDQLLATPIHDDGVWVYPGAKPEDPCLAAWWYGGVLQNATLLAGISSPEQTHRLNEQLSQIAWAGELDGWMTTTPKWHLVADAEVAQTWAPILNEWAGESVEIVSPVPGPKLAALSASRAARSRAVSLLPTEFSARYQQQNVDRLWMRGLLGALVLYIIGLVIYGSAVMVLNFQNNKVQDKLSSLTGAYTNVVQMKERVGLLQEQVALKYAALDSWKAASDLLPEGLTLTSFTFSHGQTVNLFGTVQQDQQRKLTDYNEALQSVMINGKNLEVDPPNTRVPRPDRNGQMVIDWSFNIRIPGAEQK